MLENKKPKEMTDEELESVNGGCGESWEDKHAKYLPANHGAHIGESDAINHIGEVFYFVLDEHPDSYCWGKLERVYEKSVWFGDATRKMYEVYVQGKAGSVGNYIPGIKNHLEGDSHTMYEKK